MLAGLCALLGLPLARSATAAPLAANGAVRLVSATGGPLAGHWQTWARSALVPTVTGQVTLQLTACPELPRMAGCVYTRQPRVIYVKPGIKQPRAVLLHELGHVYDLTVFSNTDRGRFRKIMRRPHTRWWSGTRPLAEWFAEAYAWCARHARIDSIADEAIYEYDPTPSQHRQTCTLIKTAARDRTPPAPPPDKPPVVTGDPAPAPTVTQPTPSATPGAVPMPTSAPRPLSTPAARTAEATPSPIRTPTPTATKTPTETPSPTRTPASTPTATVTATTTPTETAWPTLTPTPTPTPTATPSPTPTATPTPTPTATPSPTPTVTPTPTPTATPTATETPSPEPTATVEPSPTASPSPEPTATPEPPDPWDPAWWDWCWLYGGCGDPLAPIWPTVRLVP
ncbi:hypothetical protein C8N24_2031 [Solirubrobacter pauli]|uniref:Uncharacterized protein n=1 Tax=Solirubrobacter pauli TaxID=166793 RepID=A0A660LE49_9ACTN|nr:hypothetical protein C8N24_2031 [Solirubrobacter pauli]